MIIREKTTPVKRRGIVSKLESTLSERDIYCCITACNETEEEATLSLNIFKDSSMPDMALRKRIHIFIFLDRQRDHEADTVTFEAYQKLLGISDRDEAGNLKCVRENGCRIFHGWLGDVPYSLYIKGDNLISGKRYSILLFSHVAQKAAQKSIRPPSYLLFLDCDTTTQGKDVQCLIDTLEMDPDCGGVTGWLRVANLDFTNLVILLQEFYIYFYGHIIEKAADTFFGKCTCLPGAFALVRYSAFVGCLDEFSGIPRDDDFHGINCLELGEDRYMTTLLIQKGYNTRYVQKAISRTVIPDTFDGYVTQQRRWLQSTISNQVVLLFGKDSPLLKGSRWGWLQWLVTFFQFISTLLPVGITAVIASEGHFFGDLFPHIFVALIVWIYSVIFTFSVMNKAMHEIYSWMMFNFFLMTFFACYGIFGSVVNYINQDHFDATTYAIFVLMLIRPVAVVWVIFKFAKPKEWLPLLFGFLLTYFLCGIFPLITLCAFANMDNRSWGTRGITHENKGTSQQEKPLQDLPFVKGSSKWKAARVPGFVSGFSKKLVFVVAMLALNLAFIFLSVGRGYQSTTTGFLMCLAIMSFASLPYFLFSSLYHAGIWFAPLQKQR